VTRHSEKFKGGYLRKGAYGYNKQKKDLDFKYQVTTPLSASRFGVLGANMAVFTAIYPIE
jgi:hypothetical protein